MHSGCQTCRNQHGERETQERHRATTRVCYQHCCSMQHAACSAGTPLQPQQKQKRETVKSQVPSKRELLAVCWWSKGQCTHLHSETKQQQCFCWTVQQYCCRLSVQCIQESACQCSSISLQRHSEPATDNLFVSPRALDGVRALQQQLQG